MEKLQPQKMSVSRIQKWFLNKKRGRNDLFLQLAPLLGGMLQPFSLLELASKIQEILVLSIKLWDASIISNIQSYCTHLLHTFYFLSSSILPNSNQSYIASIPTSLILITLQETLVPTSSDYQGCQIYRIATHFCYTLWYFSLLQFFKI